MARLRLLGLSVGLLTATIAVGARADTGGLHLKVRIEGSGPRTVIFESGLGDTLGVWSAVQSDVSAGCARTVAYNRAGYAGSDAAESARDATHIVAELRAALRRRNILPPYVLVGHSLGGLYMQYFARNYPREVAGLVLVDSSFWNQRLPLVPTLQATDPPGNPTPADSSRTIVLFMPWIMRREIMGSAAAGAQVHASPAAAGVPTIVLSSTRHLRGETVAQEAREAGLQDDLAREFPGSEHLRVAASGHYIQRDRPDVVIAAVRRLAGCGPEAPKLPRAGKRKGAPAGR